ncbi:zinc-binding alcohol dehydrogenase family protein [uncultured Mucilaginibacter sp.]|uniref:zinc-binding alcohol dehydrogenase family protein n=1 Tax=uncultured Mucilaginibacter sp. TaxID=797541 RepID=UPI0025F564D7|nr:zinc-binding alcohol dehydrogenase family protein [uncultured Mucilaginibacter sp.]
METLVCVKPGLFRYEVRDRPELKAGHTLLKIKRIGICGTDLHAFEGTQPYFQYPRILGHELAGEIVDGDDMMDFSIGEQVTFIPYFNCGQCLACKNGGSNYCENIQVCGVHVDGGMAEYLLVPSKTLLHGQGLDLDELALVEPLAIGAHGVKRAGVRPGEFVLVIGAGPIGLGTMEFARIAGAKVIALDINETRLAFCREALNVNYTINAHSADVPAQLKKITGGHLPQVVIDATGNLKAINDAFAYLAHGGRYVLIGLQKGDIHFNHPEFHKREGTLMSSRNATRDDFELVIGSIKNGSINPLMYITHQVKFNEVKDSFSDWLLPETNVIKAMVALED